MSKYAILLVYYLEMFLWLTILNYYFANTNSNVSERFK